MEHATSRTWLRLNSAASSSTGSRLRPIWMWKEITPPPPPPPPTPPPPPPPPPAPVLVLFVPPENGRGLGARISGGALIWAFSPPVSNSAKKQLGVTTTWNDRTGEWIGKLATRPGGAARAGIYSVERCERLGRTELPKASEKCKRIKRVSDKKDDWLTKIKLTEKRKGAARRQTARVWTQRQLEEP